MTISWLPQRLLATLAIAMLAASVLPLTAGAEYQRGPGPAFLARASLSVQLDPAGPINLNAGAPALLTTTVKATASGGIGSYTYAWTRTSGSHSSIFDLPSGNPSIGAIVNWGDHFAETWTVTATDAAGVTGTGSVDINFASPSADGVPDAANRVPIAGVVTQYRLTTALPIGQTTYPVQVYVPADDASTSGPLPVIYATDGGPLTSAPVSVTWEFSDMVRIIEAQHLRIAVVGIGGSETRSTDYLLPGADRFYQFLTTEIIPFVEARYDIDSTNRTLSGHSYGGLFCGLVFLQEHPGARFFSNYIALDGSFWVNPIGNVAMEQALVDATGGALPDTTLVLSSSAQGNDASVTLFYQQLAACGFQGLQLDRIPNFNTGHLLMYDEAFAASLQLISANLPAAWTPPAITTQPLGGTVVLGSALRLQVTAVGGGLAYQWFIDGIAIAGATGSTYSVSNATNADAGTYTVAISNRAGTANSSPVTVAVTTPATPPAQGPSSDGNGGGAPSVWFYGLLSLLALAHRVPRRHCSRIES
jgi:hypothetical protein